MPHRRTVRHQTSKSQKKDQPDPAVERDEANKRRFIDQTGIEARDLPDGGRGPIETDPHKEMQRNLPHQHGGELYEDSYSEGGLRGDRKISEADDYGGRKRN